MRKKCDKKYNESEYYYIFFIFEISLYSYIYFKDLSYITTNFSERAMNFKKSRGKLHLKKRMIAIQKKFNILYKWKEIAKIIKKCPQLFARHLFLDI